MIFKRLLAKQCAQPDNPPCRFTLTGHTADVITAAQTLVDTVGEKCLTMTGLQEYYSPEELHKTVVLSAALHDIGKAANTFQLAVRGRRSQALRHEWISAWLALHPPMDRWLFSGWQKKLRTAVISAALGHHLKAKKGECPKPRSGGGESEVLVLCEHNDFAETLKLIAKNLSLPNPPGLQNLTIDLVDDVPLSSLSKWMREDSLDQASAVDKRFVALVKALVIASDVAGSANADKGINLEEWIPSVLSRVCDKNDYKRICGKRLSNKPLRNFQETLSRASQSQVYLVRAGCGSGKTVGAYLWAMQCAVGRKLFFCYPTTGTATEGFKDYVFDFVTSDGHAPELRHSRKEVDLEGILPADTDTESDDTVRFESLRTWDIPLVVCTVDQVLGLMQNVRSGLYSFPSIINGAFVFDEIHLYDDRLFAALSGFLATFPNLPVLLMTASLQPAQLDLLRELLGGRLSVIDATDSMKEKGEEPSWENTKRYRLHPVQKSPPWEHIKEIIDAKGKVLWVTNLVDRAINFYNEAGNKGFDPICYHSRFRYEDRSRQHKAVMEAFGKKSSSPALVIATQVCEVSLDISADLLISDLAPVPSLIQRLGRLNRREKVDMIKDAIFLEPESIYPYSQDKTWCEKARAWLEPLIDRQSVSQLDLADGFEKIDIDNAPDIPSVKLHWIDGEVFSEPGHLREPGFNLAFILDKDEPCCRSKGKLNYKEITRRTIPMPARPVKNEIQSWHRLAHAYVAPPQKIDYGKHYGAQWADRKHIVL